MARYLASLTTDRLYSTSLCCMPRGIIIECSIEQFKNVPLMIFMACTHKPTYTADCSPTRLVKKNRINVHACGNVHVCNVQVATCALKLITYQDHSIPSMHGYNLIEDTLAAVLCRDIVLFSEVKNVLEL